MENTLNLRCGKMYPALFPPQEDVTLRLCCKRSQKPKFQCLALENGQTPVWLEAEALISLGACTTPNISEQHSGALQAGLTPNRYLVRRLIPVECERLQGYPDDWTLCGADGLPISDTSRYQMLGNSIAVPCVAYIMQGIVLALEKR